ncbi:MAG: hypothetical protein RL198_431 [Actinomycetota bacterium]
MGSSLYQVLPAAQGVQSGLPVVAMLSGFSDAGQCTSQVAEHVFANLEAQPVVEFSSDELLDYRSRRPTMLFEKDHITDYQPARLAIYLARDEVGREFLLLEGYEPDLRWESFAEAILELLQRFEVAGFTWLHSIPFPIPHTRSVGITVSGNRSDLVERFSEWRPQTQVPGNVMHLLEYRLSPVFDVAGFVLLVPHYLADTEYPAAALKGFELLTAATELVFPTDSLREDDHKFVGRLTQQISENAELEKLIATLEAGYSSSDFGPSRAPIRKPAQQVPSAEELAEQLENYLAQRLRSADDESSS